MLRGIYLQTAVLRFYLSTLHLDVHTQRLMLVESFYVAQKKDFLVRYADSRCIKNGKTVYQQKKRIQQCEKCKNSGKSKFGGIEKAEN